MATAAQKRSALKAYMSGQKAESLCDAHGMTAAAIERAYLELDRLERLGLMRELRLEQIRTVEAELATIHARLAVALSKKSTSKGSAETSVKNLVTSIAILIDKQDVLQKQLDSIESSMAGTKRRRTNNSLKVRTD